MDNIQPGQNLGPYRIINQIGQGGMATVYKAYHAAMDRYVAIKVLPRQLAESPEFVGRFQQEARTIANLEHPHILPVHDYGESEGITYLVMRFLDAGTLKERLQGSAPSLTEIDRLFAQLADALAYAHDHGVVHRDLKPSNVLVDARGNLFLTDFGIAKLLEASPQFTSTGAMIGTPAYMSPEQAQGLKVDQRSDIYSLGIILYEMITGRVPYEAETPLAVVLKHLNEPLPIPSSVKPGISPAIERVILKALSKNVDDRFASVAEFQAAWRQAFSEAQGEAETVAAAPPAPTAAATTVAASTPPAATVPTVASPTTPTAPPVTRKGLPIGWIVGGVGVLALLILVVFGVPQIQRALGPGPEATQAATTAPQPTPGVATSAPGETAVPTVEATTGPVATGEGAWASWTTGNIIFTIAVHGDEIYTGGWGGITVWNRADGTVLQRITTGNGLPNVTVRALLVDDDGTLWAGTERGLARYDPAADEWTIYDTADGLDSDTVTALVRAGDRLIVGTQYSGDGGGLNVFDGQAWSHLEFPSASADEQPDVLSSQVNVVLPDENDGLWVGTDNGLGYFDGANWTRYSTAEGLPGNRIFALTFDGNHDLGVGTDAGAARFNGQIFEATPQGPPYGVYGIVQDAQGRYWFSGGGGVWRFDPAKADWQEFSEQTGDMPEYNMFTAAQDADGNLYFASDGGGLARYDGEDFAVWAVSDVPVMAAFGHIIPAPADQLWFIEEYGSYPDRFNLSDETWLPYLDSPCSCAPLAFDPNGSLWGTEWENGAWIVAPDGAQTHLTAENGLPSNMVTAVAFDPIDGHFLLGTDSGVVHLDPNLNVVEVFDTGSAGLVNNNVHALMTTAEGDTWVGTDGGVSHLKPDFTWEHFPIGQPFTENLDFISDFAQDAEGAIWVATLDDWVYHYSNGEWEKFEGGDPGVKLPSPYVGSVTVAPDGSLWFGTSDGAARFDGNEWTLFDVGDGLIHLQVNDIYFDAAGAIWFATSGGVTRYTP
jgi:ligand-binding sensor domain-containing protein/tRNA A-37 threonylcarbamoyl transferase component Bud32